MINALIKHLQNIALKKATKKNKRIRQFKNLDDIQTVGIIFKRDSDQTAANMQKLAKYFHEQGQHVSVLAYVDIKKPTPELLSKKSLILFYRKDVNWLQKPKKGDALDFAKQPFDLLIKADFSQAYPLAYICATAKASLIAGPNDPMNKIYDFIIETKNESQNDFHQQLIHYLSVINQKSTQNQPNYAE